ncbi:MAG: AraC family transcriptional regulator [Burkholderiales bacterium]|nr:AraC family transcriptional regulator [Burkholderiales bacterium]
MLIAQLSIGYSLGAAAVLALTHFNARQYPGQRSIVWAGWGLLAVLCALQAAHAAWLWGGLAWVQAPWYGALLFAVAPCFYVLARQVLEPGAAVLGAGRFALHLLPMAMAFWWPVDVCLPWAFGLGTLYLAWLLRSLWGLRAQRLQWRQELALVGLALAMGGGVCILGLWQAWQPDAQFFAWYAVSIGLALWLVQWLLGLRPHLPQEVQEVQALSGSYASSTLGSVDVPTVLARLDGLMHGQQRYRDPALNLPTLAQELGLGAHQLSELVNTRLGKGFSRYLRELRIQDAKQMLVQEPSASVLSVGLSAGFAAQSNFYEAFREIEGMTPGRYRKLMAAQAPPMPQVLTPDS